jgi:hypothetical protein
MVLTVELEFTSPSLLSRARKMFCWPRHRAPKPGSPDYTTPHTDATYIRRRCRPQTSDRELPGVAAYPQILRCAADAKVIVTGYRGKPLRACPTAQPAYDKPILPLYARRMPSASGPVVNETNLHTLQPGRRTLCRRSPRTLLRPGTREPRR